MTRKYFNGETYTGSEFKLSAGCNDETIQGIDELKKGSKGNSFDLSLSPVFDNSVNTNEVSQRDKKLLKIRERSPQSYFSQRSGLEQLLLVFKLVRNS